MVTEKLIKSYQNLFDIDSNLDRLVKKLNY